MRFNIQDGVGILEIDTHGNNAINGAFVGELNQLLDDIEVNTNVGAVLLTARHENMFSPGLDVIALYDLSYSETRNFVSDFSKLYLRLFALPKPLVVAINGHAIAGGLILAMAGDVRLVKAGEARLGLSEMDLGLPLPAGCLEMLRYYLSHRALEQMLYTARLLTPGEAQALKAVDGVIEAGQWQKTVFEQAAQLARKPARAFALTKEHLREECVERIERRDEEHLDELLDVWTSEEARLRLGMLVGKLKSRKA